MIEPPPDCWDVYWKYFNELLTPPLPPESWGVVKGCESVVQLLKEYNCQRVLEAASGIGLKAITFRRMGFDVVGMDICATGIELSRKLAETVSIPLEFHELSWDSVPSQWAGQFDAVFIDQVLNVRTVAELTSAAKCAWHALRPGGIFLFGAMDAEEWDMTAEERLARRWPEKPLPRIAWTRDHGDRQSTTIAASEPYSRGIYHSFLHLTQSGSQRSLEHSGFLENLSWSWEELTNTLIATGFSQVIRRPMPGGSVSAIAIR
jgi:SAM-dependent methyltransferase